MKVKPVNIAQWRIRHNLTQAELAEKLPVKIKTFRSLARPDATRSVPIGTPLVSAIAACPARTVI
jgi:transcriptional regulator with XRE-family HTH domain